VLRQRRTSVPPRPKRAGLPQGSGSLAIIRCLLERARPGAAEPSTSILAARAGVSQPRASQVLRRLRELGLLDASDGHRWRPDRAALLDRFVAEYPGPGGSVHGFHSSRSPMYIAELVSRVNTPEDPLVVSADVGPDLIAPGTGPDLIVPWERPSVVVIYARHEISPSLLGLVEAGVAAGANVVLRVPADRSVFPVPPLEADAGTWAIPLVDPAQMIWELHDLGGADRLEAAGAMRDWILDID
jgi:hypothetical protein